MVRFKMVSFILCVCVGIFFISPQKIFAETVSSAKSREEETFQTLQSGKIPQSPDTDPTYGAPSQRTVYLTFDDGPSKLTEQVLDILKKEEVQATFFMIGQEAEAHPDLVKRVVKEGHALGNHSYDHVYKDLYSDYGHFWKQIKQTQQILFDQVGFYPQLLRAPGGTSTNFDAFYFYFLKQAGYSVTDWNVDCGDTARRNVPAKEIIQNVKKASLHHEMNVLIHDGSGHQSSVQALPEIIHYLKQNGYAFARLTPEVKPIQFPVVKIKWKRSLSFARFEELEKEARAYASEFGNKTSDAASASVPTESSAQPEQTSFLTPSQSEVSIRALSEKLGGKVFWLQEESTAQVHLGFYDFEFNVPNRSIRVYLYGKQVSSYLLFPMKLEEGTLHIPSSSKLALFGGQTAGMLMQAERPVISIGWFLIHV